MLAFKKCSTEMTFFQVGDQLIVNLKGFGEFTATAHLLTDKGILFMFDDCIINRRMNKKNTNDGGYDNSELAKWINTTLKNSFPDDIKTRITSISIPSYGQMFSHDDWDEWYERYIEPDDDEWLPLMKKRKNRIADYKGDFAWYWLKNATQKSLSAANFARVSRNGNATYSRASSSGGVRPVFWLA